MAPEVRAHYPIPKLGDMKVTAGVSAGDAADRAEEGRGGELDLFSQDHLLTDHYI